MESFTESFPKDDCECGNQDGNTNSAENFQKFMYDLFEKNGVIHDLRAYLRGLIVGVLKSAQTGEPPSSLKHFTQRLELPYQAFNMLIAEYLLSMGFSYSLSVFVSEIPLANMVFAFAKRLMQGSDNDAPLRFMDIDVWAILQYLGVKCDSEHASNIFAMYQSDPQVPLLACMLKCIPMYTDTHIRVLQDELSKDTNCPNTKRSDPAIDGTKHNYYNDDICKHYSFCGVCQNNVSKIKEDYKEKKRKLTQNITDSNTKRVESLLESLGVIEKNLIEEMFQQLKSVYESEMEIVKNAEEKHMKRSLASHAEILQKKREEMEAKFKVREEELKKNVNAKKAFLWGLARDLREQHQHLTKAMQEVRVETKRLSDKEESLKTQLTEWEQILRSRGDDMRRQISSELSVLEGHLLYIKNERDTINKERLELEHLKNLSERTAKLTNLATLKEKEDYNNTSHHDLLKTEFNIIKKYLEKAKLEPKCLIERSTITELADVTSKIDVILNNGQDVESNTDLRAKRVVNDLKKNKNVNFRQSNLRGMSMDDNPACHSTSEVGDERLREDNERLREFVTQQRSHIDELSSQQARLQAELTSARTAPPRLNTGLHAAAVQQRLRSSASSDKLYTGWCKGAGEELTLILHETPRIVVPGDSVPFIGVIQDCHASSTRFLINQWRPLKNPAPNVAASPPTSIPKNITAERTSNADPCTSSQPEDNTNDDGKLTDRPHFSKDIRKRPKTADGSVKKPEQTSKSVLREKARRERSPDQSLLSRQTSPNSVIRDAKRRLRKLEIEAEAVEKSYLDFRKKRRQKDTTNTEHTLKQLDINFKMTPKTADKDHKENVTSSRDNLIDTHATLDFKKYIQQYHDNYDLGETHFRNRNATSSRINPIPIALMTTEKSNENKNYLDTPLTEFRKFYQSDKRVKVVGFEGSNVCPNVIDNKYTEECRMPPDTTFNITQNDENPQMQDESNKDSPKSKVVVSAESNKAYPNYTILSPKKQYRCSPSKDLDNCEFVDSVSPIIMDVIDNEHDFLADLCCDKNQTPIREILAKEPDKKHHAECVIIEVESPRTNRDRSRSLTNSPIPKSKRDNINLDDAEKSYSLKLDEPHSSSSNSINVTSIANIDKVSESIVRAKQNKAKELEILKKNIEKMYKGMERSINENLIKYQFIEAEDKAIEDNNIPKIANDSDKNMLRIELQNQSEGIIKVPDKLEQEYSVVVETSLEVIGQTEYMSKKDEKTTQILISPEKAPESDDSKTQPIAKDLVSEPILSHKENLRSIELTFHHGNDEKSLQDISGNSIAESEPRDADYLDEFSCDVDNLNSLRYNYTDQSHISVLKSSDNETFWDS